MINSIISNDIELYNILKLSNISNSNIDTQETKSPYYDMKIYENMIDNLYENDNIDSCENNLLSNFKSAYDDCEIINIKSKPLYTGKKIPYCDDCKGWNIIEDTSKGNIVCTDCGQVLSNIMDSGAEWSNYNDENKKDMSRCSHPISQLLPQSSMATTIGGACSSRIKTIHKWGTMPYKERSLNDVFKIIQSKCSGSKIMKCIEDDAKIMYKNISDCKHIEGKNLGKSVIIRGKNRMSVIAACILFACRKKDKTRSPKEIAKLFGLKHTEITKGCKIFQKLAKIKNMDLNLHSILPEHFITRFCDELKIKSNYIDQAIQIAFNVQKLQIAASHTPSSIAAGSIFMMVYLNELDIQKKTIADKLNVSQVTISKAFKKLEPFANLLTNDEMCNKLKTEIKNYQENIVLTEELVPKFIRFNINTNDVFGNKTKIELFNIIDFIGDIFILNEKLITEHNIEIDYKIKSIDNEFIRLSLNFTEDLYEIASKDFIKY